MRKNKNDALSTQSQGKVGTIIGPGAVFDGNLTAPETIRLDGTLNGDCVCEGNLILGTDGIITGNITAKNATLSGKVTGDITVKGKLELFSTAKVLGNITSKSLIIDENACFDGRCTMTTALHNASGAPADNSPKQGKNKSRDEEETVSKEK